MNTGMFLSRFCRTPTVHAHRNQLTVISMTPRILSRWRLDMYGTLCAVRERKTFSTLWKGENSIWTFFLTLSHCIMAHLRSCMCYSTPGRTDTALYRTSSIRLHHPVHVCESSSLPSEPLAPSCSLLHVSKPQKTANRHHLML